MARWTLSLAGAICAVGTPLGASGHPSRPLPGSPVLITRDGIRDSYDYVIIGGGTAGLTIGDRLSESGKYTVLAIEYGNLEPEGYRQGQTTYNITSAPCPELNNRTFQVDVGCIVGGSSAVNGRIFQRGAAKDYDIWGELGGDGAKSSWNWQNLLGYFKKAVQLTPPKPEIPADFHLKYDMEYWGHNTSNHSIFGTYGNVLKPSIAPLYDALKQIPGVDTPVDGGAGQTGLVYYPTSSDPRTGARSYSRTGHFDGLDRANYELLPATRVNKIVFERDVAVGVQITPRGGGKKSASVVRVKKEVILTAGALHTPQILQLSGIGPADLLKRANIPVKVDLPGVGSNFQDHLFIPEVSFRWGTPPPIPAHLANSSVMPDGLGVTFLGLVLSLPVVAPNDFASIAARYEAQDPAAHLPEDAHPSVVRGYRQQQSILAREMRSRQLTFVRITISGEPTFVPVMAHPISRGTVRIDPAAGADVETEPIVDYRAATNPIDIDVAVAAIKFLRHTLTAGVLAAYNATEVVPGPDYATDAQLATFVRARLIPSVYHPVGTAAKMPRAWGGVVGEDLLVYGVERLSVADASIMPTIAGATTSMTVYAIAEKAADIIKVRQRGGGASD